MKKCTYCGHENSDTETHCWECGTQEFENPVAPFDPEPKRRSTLSHVLFRLASSACVFMAVSGLSLYVAWQSVREVDAASFEQAVTKYRLRQLNQTLTEYQQRFHTLPASLDQLWAMTNGVAPSSEEAGLDGWKRPLLFSTNGSDVIIMSYGRDGKPGGRGIDYDLTNKKLRPKESFPTFQQFLWDLPTKAMIVACLVCGALAFLLSLFAIEVPDLSLPSLASLGFKLVLTTIGAVIVALIISAFHIPSGH
jgi:hypothetical protein